MAPASVHFQKRNEYISCALVCLCVTTTPMPLVTVLVGASVSEPLSSLVGENA